MYYICLSYRSRFFFFKQKTAYEMRISDWSSDVCSSDLNSPTKRHALTLSARKLTRLAIQQVFDSLNICDFAHSSMDFWFRCVAHLQAKAHIAENVHVRIQGIALKHHGDVAIFGWNVLNFFITDQDTPTRNVLKPCKHAQRGGLRSEEHTSELQSLMRISYAVFCLKKKTI